MVLKYSCQRFLCALNQILYVFIHLSPRAPCNFTKRTLQMYYNTKIIEIIKSIERLQQYILQPSVQQLQRIN